MATKTLEGELGSILPRESILVEGISAYLGDETEVRGRRGRADAVVLPATTDEVARTLAWCDAHDVPLIPRGGGTGFAGGAVPLDGGIVLALERLARVRSFEPLLWRISVEAGVTTAAVRRLARENGLMFPPDPGAAEQSQIGGNIATNAGGPHAFKYGTTGAWVTGLEAVLPPGEVVSVGGPIRKDVAGYDLKSLLIGSEGTLAFTTQVELRLWPVIRNKVLGVCHFGSFYEAMDAAQHLVKLRPIAVELVDRTMIALGRDIAMFRPVIEATVRGDPDALLIVEFAEEDQPENLQKLKQLSELMADLGFGWNHPQRKWGGVVDVIERATKTAIADYRTSGLIVMM